MRRFPFPHLSSQNSLQMQQTGKADQKKAAFHIQQITLIMFTTFDHGISVEKIDGIKRSELTIHSLQGILESDDTSIHNPLRLGTLAPIHWWLSSNRS